MGKTGMRKGPISFRMRVSDNSNAIGGERKQEVKEENIVTKCPNHLLPDVSFNW